MAPPLQPSSVSKERAVTVAGGIMRPRRVAIGPGDDDLDPTHHLDHDPSLLDDAGTREAPGGVFRLLLVAAVTGLTIIPLSWLAIRGFVDPDRIATWIAPRASAALGRDVSFGEAGIALFPRPGLLVSDVRVANPPGLEGPALAAADHVHLDVSLSSLITGSVVVRRARVYGVRVYMSVDADGDTNFGDLFPERSSVVGGASGPPIRFGLRGITLSDAGLTYFDANADQSFAVVGTEWALDVSEGEGGGWTVDGRGSSDSLHVRFPRLSEEILRTDGPEFGVTLHGDHRLDWIEIERGAIQQSGETLTVQGRVEGISGSDPRVNLTFANPALGGAVLAGLVPAGMRSREAPPRSEGELDVALSLKGPIRSDRGPVLSGRVVLSGVGVRLGSVSLLDGVDGMIRVGADTVGLDSIRGSFAGGPLSLTGRFQRGSGAVAVALQAAPDLDALDRLGLTPAGSELAGDAEFDVTVTGVLGEPETMDVVGAAAVRGLQVGHDRVGVPLYVPAASFELSEGELRWSDLTLLAGEESLTTSGRWTAPLAGWLAERPPRIDATLSGDHLDLGGVLPNAGGDVAHSYSHIAFAHLGNTPLDGRRATAVASRAGYGRPASLPLHGRLDLELGTLTYRAHLLESLQATLTMTDSVFAFQDVAFDTWGGRVTGALRLGLGDALGAPFALEAEVVGVDAGDFLSTLTPVGTAVAGRLSSTFAIRGETDRNLMPLLGSLDGGGRIEVEDGQVTGTGLNLALADFLSADEWRDVHVSRWVTDLQLGDGMLDVTETRLVGELGTARLSGTLGLGGAADLSMGLSIPPEHLRAVSLRRTGVAQTVLDRLRSTRTPLDLGMRVSGSLQGPTLEPDALAASERR